MCMDLRNTFRQVLNFEFYKINSIAEKLPGLVTMDDQLQASSEARVFVNNYLKK
jgi:hypothetical protein